MTDGEGLFSRRQRTIDCWFLTASLLHRPFPADAERDDVLKQLEETEAALNSLSDTGVASEAAQTRRDVIDLLTATRQFLADEKSPQEATQELLRRLPRDGLLKALECLNAEHDLRKRLEQLRTNVRDRREKLSKRNGSEFPHLGP